VSVKGQLIELCLALWASLATFWQALHGGLTLPHGKLYVQGLDPELPPSLSYISQDEIALYDRIKAALKP